MKNFFTLFYCLFILIFTVKSQCTNNWLYVGADYSGVQIGNLNITGDKITIEAKFNRITPNAGPGEIYQGDIVSKHNNPSDDNYLLRPDETEITTTNGYFRTPDICDIDTNKTYYAAMVYDGDSLKFYRNGFLMSAVPASGNLFQNNWITTIGSIASGKVTNYPEYLSGYINEVRIWNVARTQSQLQQYMNTSLPNPTTQSGLLAYYKFNSLTNLQGNTAWNGSIIGSASIGTSNPTCSNFIADSCDIQVSTGCSGTLGDPIVDITFGSGVNNPGPQLSAAVPGASTTYNYASYATGTPPAVIYDGDYALVNEVPDNGSWFIGATDHTGDANGYMAFFNASVSPGEFYTQNITGLSSGTTYEFAAWIANVLNPAVFPNAVPPNITFEILDTSTQSVLGMYNTGDILQSQSMTWIKYNLLFTVPEGLNAVTFKLINNNVGGTQQEGNDLAIDDITIRPCLSSMPLTLKSFSGMLVGKSVKLYWTTSNEINTTSDIVERSYDGNNFTDISSLPAKGSLQQNYYQYLDVPSFTNVNVYYRIKFLDKDGSYTYSKVLVFSLLNSTSAALQIFPNPAKNYVQLNYSSVTDETTSLRIFDVSGKTIIEKNMISYKGNNSATVDFMNKLLGGTYFLEMILNGKIITSKIIVQ